MLKFRCDILIVEDDPEIRKQFEEILTYEGYSIASVSNGHEALDFLTSLSDVDLPRSILLDLWMPVMNGEEFLKNISLVPGLRNIPVVITSAKIPQYLPILKDRLFLKKPMDVEDLVSVFQKLLKFNQAH